MKFSHGDRQLTINALYLAATEYDSCAITSRATPGHQRMAAQFETQAADARRIAGEIESSAD